MKNTSKIHPRVSTKLREADTNFQISSEWSRREKYKYQTSFPPLHNYINKSKEKRKKKDENIKLK